MQPAGSSEVGVGSFYRHGRIRQSGGICELRGGVAPFRHVAAIAAMTASFVLLIDLLIMAFSLDYAAD